MTTQQLEGKDEGILRELQADAAQTTKQLARKLGLTMTTVHNRKTKLENAGVIRGYRAVADHAKAGRPVCAYVLVTVSYPTRKFSQAHAAERIAQFEEVAETAIVTGETDIVAKVRVKDTAALNEFITRKLRAVEGVDKTVTWVVLSEFEHKGQGGLRRQ